MSADRLREMLSEATPAPWPKTPFELLAHLSGRDAPLVALAPDAIALLADFGELLQAFYDDLPIETSAGKELLRRLDALCGDER